MNILYEIRRKREIDVKHSASIVPLERLREECRSRTDYRPFFQELTKPGIRIIAEIKQASPSAGVLVKQLELEQIARHYATAGAAAISVLTEPNYFLGSVDYLRRVRSAVTVPVLQKDFIFSDYQLYEAALAGADAVLLIVRLLSDSELTRLCNLATGLGLVPVIEIYDDSDLSRLSQIPPNQLIGINNRDLQTLHTNNLHAFSLVDEVLEQQHIPIIFSGIRSRNDLSKYLDRSQCFLIGEYLMCADDRVTTLKEMLA